MQTDMLDKMLWSEEELIRMIKEQAIAIGQNALAVEIGIFPSHLSMIVNQQRGISQTVLDYFNLEKITMYKLKEGSSQKVDNG